jgi:hypothetical protein
LSEIAGEAIKSKNARSGCRADVYVILCNLMRGFEMALGRNYVDRNRFGLQRAGSFIKSGR